MAELDKARPKIGEKIYNPRFDSTRKRRARLWRGLGLTGVFAAVTLLVAVGLSQKSVNTQNAAMSTFIERFQSSAHFVEVANTNSVERRLVRQPLALVWVGDKLFADCKKPTVSLRCKTVRFLHIPLPVSLAAGGRDNSANAVILVNLWGDWINAIPMLASQAASASERKSDEWERVVWVSFVLWHELGHTFQTEKTRGGISVAASCLFEPSSNKNALLNRETAADIFALVALARPSDGQSSPVLDKAAFDRFKGELVSWRRKETDQAHKTALLLDQLNWNDTQSDVGTSSGRPAEALLAEKLLRVARQRANLADTCK